MSPEPELTIARDSPAREVSKAGRARVIRELLAETNGPYTTSELSYFLAVSCEARAASSGARDTKFVVTPNFVIPTLREAKMEESAVCRQLQQL